MAKIFCQTFLTSGKLALNGPANGPVMIYVTVKMLQLGHSVILPTWTTELLGL